MAAINITDVNKCIVVMYFDVSSNLATITIMLKTEVNSSVILTHYDSYRDKQVIK